ncbi:hypothetical protein D1007_19766 [Hordeum vulgare]|nr:hypothetical protein D1007_19766 [Hordeum vulgare]
MQSLQEDYDKPNIAPKAKLTEAWSFSPAPSIGDDDSAFPTSESFQFFETISSASEESSHAEPDGRLTSQLVHTIERQLFFTNIQ